MHSEPDRRVHRHPIGVVAARTGLSQELLRVWERRYGVVDPARDAGGQRLYSDADVERLRLLRRATQGGRSIGQVAALSLEQLIRLVREDQEAAGFPGAESDGDPAQQDVERALERCGALDAGGLEALLRHSLAVLGITAFSERVAVPLLRRVGGLWHAGQLTVAQEHLTTAAVRRVVIGALDSLSAPPDAPGLLLTTLAGERHEIGVLLAAASAAAEGWRVTYLGTELPTEEIVAAALGTDARAVGVSVVYVSDPGRVAAELRGLRDRLPATVSLLAGGAGALSLAGELRAARIRVFGDLAALRAMLRSERRPR